MKIDPTKLWLRLLHRTPVRYRGILRTTGTLLSWILLLESSASILLGVTLVRSTFSYLYSFLHPYLQDIANGLYIIIFSLVQIWRAILNPLLELAFKLFGFTIPGSVVELIIISIFAIRSYMVISSRSRTFSAITDNMPKTLNNLDNLAPSRLAEIELDQIRLSLTNTAYSVDSIVSSFDNATTIETKKNLEAKAEASKELARESRNRVKNSPHNPVIDYVNPEKKYTKTEIIASSRPYVHNIGENIRTLYLNEFRQSFLNASFSEYGIEVYLSFPYFHEDNTEITPLLFYDTALSRDLLTKKEERQKSKNTLIRVISTLSENQVPFYLEMTNGFIETRASGDVALISLEKDNIKRFPRLHNSEDEYAADNMYPELIRLSIRRFYIEKILRKAYLSIGRKTIYSYAALSAVTIIIFILDQVLF